MNTTIPAPPERPSSLVPLRPVPPWPGDDETPTVRPKRMQEDEEEELLLDVQAIAIALAVRQAGEQRISVAALAERLKMEPNRHFRLLLWQQMERYREETGRHLRIVAGHVVACTDEEQIHEANKRWRTAAARSKRAYDMIAPLLSSGDIETLAKVERFIGRQVVEQAAIDATAAAHERDQHIARTIRAALRPQKDRDQK